EHRVRQTSDVLSRRLWGARSEPGLFGVLSAGVDEISGPGIAHLPVETTYRLLLIGTHLTVAGSVHSILEVELLGKPFTDKHSHRPIHRSHGQAIIDTLLIQGCDDLLVTRHDSVLVVEELTVRTSLAHLLRSEEH